MYSAVTFNSILLSITSLLDYMEMDILENVTNHGRRVSYISLRIGEKLGFTQEELFDLGALALLHDVGVTHSFTNQTFGEKRSDDLEKHQGHCIYGQKILDNFPGFQRYGTIILYHHENFDGSGFFGKSGDEIPLMAQIISLADTLERRHLSRDSGYQNKTILQDVHLKTGTLFNPFLSTLLLDIAQEKTFWMDLEPQNIEFGLVRHLPEMRIPIDGSTFRSVAETISAIVDAKSPFTSLHCKDLEQKALIYAEHCNFSAERIEKLRLAALFHDLGKLVVPSTIINKTGSLSSQEMEIIREHPYYTEKTLQIMGVDPEIVRWASNHHEKLNGHGYPKGLVAEQMDYGSRILAALDVYQALTEDRPYRRGYSHENAIQILFMMAEKNELDREVCEQINNLPM